MQIHVNSLRFGFFFFLLQMAGMSRMSIEHSSRISTKAAQCTLKTDSPFKLNENRNIVAQKRGWRKKFFIERTKSTQKGWILCFLLFSYCRRRRLNNKQRNQLKQHNVKNRTNTREKRKSEREKNRKEIHRYQYRNNARISFQFLFFGRVLRF